jgi:DNA-binding NtrC family response regulator
MTQVLILEPDPGKRARLRDTLEGNGYAVVEPGMVKLEPHALESIDLSGYDCVIASTQPCADRSFDVLSLGRSALLILVAEHGDVRQAVRAIKRGAWDYLAAPSGGDAIWAGIATTSAWATFP